MEDWQDRESLAIDINDHGVVVGWVALGSDDARYPFIWSQGVTTIIRGHNLGTPIAINKGEQVLIRGTDSNGDYIWHSGRLTPIGANVVAYGLDNLGRVVGELKDDSGGASKGVVWEEGTLSTIPGFSSIRAINEQGQLAGLDEGGLPVFWDGAQRVELGAEFKLPIGVSAGGLVLGQGWDSFSFVYWDGARKRLNGQLSLSFVEGHGSDISANGDIVGPVFAIRTDLGPHTNNCRDESCETFHHYYAIWRSGCFGSCCGGSKQVREYHADGAGGEGAASSNDTGGAGAGPLP